MDFTGWMLIRYIDQLSLNLFYYFNLSYWLFGIMEGSYKVTIIIGSYYSSLCTKITFLALLHIQSLSYICAELWIMTLLVSFLSHDSPRNSVLAQAISAWKYLFPGEQLPVQPVQLHRVPEREGPAPVVLIVTGYVSALLPYGYNCLSSLERTCKTFRPPI